MRFEIHDRGHTRWVAAFTSALNKAKFRFEWTNSLQKADVNYILLMDDKRTWWHGCYQEVIELLTPYRPLCIGASMGGYGALMFAEEMGCEARAFGPQTLISEDGMASIGDPRWADFLPKAREAATRGVDLSMSGDQYHIHYCSRFDLDAKHAERLDVRLIPLDCDVHAAARVARFNFE